MNLEPAIACLVEATAEMGERLAGLELLADTELEKARTARYRGHNDTAKRHLLAQRNHEAEASRVEKLLHETEELLGKFQTVTAKYKKLLKQPISSELELPSDTQLPVKPQAKPNWQVETCAFGLTSYENNLDEELEALKLQLLAPEEAELEALKRSPDQL